MAINSNLISISFLRDASMISDVPNKIVYLRRYLVQLETELRKIQEDKHQLPLSVSILEKIIGEIYKEIQLCTNGKKDTVVLKEFLPLKSGHFEKEEAKEEITDEEKKEWLKSAKLCINNNSTAGKCTVNNNQGIGEAEIVNYINPYKYIFKRFENREQFFAPPQDDLRLRSDTLTRNAGTSRTDLNVTIPPLILISQKPRRTWSGELHTRFVAACEMLGGALAATPKQIQQVMAIEDLTIDEIKSHLQKYRKHILKNRQTSAAAPAVSAPSTASGSVMVDGSFARESSILQYSAVSSDGHLVHMQRQPFSGGFGDQYRPY